MEIKDIKFCDHKDLPIKEFVNIKTTRKKYLVRFRTNYHYTNQFWRVIREKYKNELAEEIEIFQIR